MSIYRFQQFERALKGTSIISVPDSPVWHLNASYVSLTIRFGIQKQFTVRFRFFWILCAPVRSRSVYLQSGSFHTPLYVVQPIFDSIRSRPVRYSPKRHVSDRCRTLTNLNGSPSGTIHILDFSSGNPFLIQKSSPQLI